MKRSRALEMMSNLQRKKFALKVRRDGPQSSIFVRSFRSFTTPIWAQAFIGRAQVWWRVGSVVAIRRRKGQLLAMVRGWGRWYPVESVSSEYARRQFLSP